MSLVERRSPSPHPLSPRVIIFLPIFIEIDFARLVYAIAYRMKKRKRLKEIRRSTPLRDRRRGGSTTILPSVRRKLLPHASTRVAEVPPSKEVIVLNERTTSPSCLPLVAPEPWGVMPRTSGQTLTSKRTYMRLGAT